jgi:hypothetical protein
MSWLQQYGEGRGARYIASGLGRKKPDDEMLQEEK